MKNLLTLFAFFVINLQTQAIDAIHGMVIFGKENLYAYHLPMFHKVHNKQMVLSFEVPQDIKIQIIELQESQFLTFVPAPFDLEQFIKTPFNLTGDLYLGHFEKDGELILSNITISAPKILFLETLTRLSANISYESYKIFGTKSDAYALHIINGGTKIDQIFKLQSVGTFDFEYAKSFNLNDQNLLRLGSDYKITLSSGRCPGRLCGAPAQHIAHFKVELLYFEDGVM